MNPKHLLKVVTTCKGRDLPVLEITVRQIKRNLACSGIFVISPSDDCRAVRRRLGDIVNVIDERNFIPGMNMDNLRKLDVPHFPSAAGWYFQQLLKLQYAFVDQEEDYYLIWDADTIPLRPMSFFDSNGIMLLTKADEFHAPYFATYRQLLGSDPNREFSMIAQHMVVQKSIAREMLMVIQERVGGTDSWPWKIMRSLPKQGDNLFSEYETYGHYIKMNYPERLRFIERNWLRNSHPNMGCSIPTQNDLLSLAKKYDYVAFERAAPKWRRLARIGVKLRNMLAGHKRLALAQGDETASRSRKRSTG